MRSRMVWSFVGWWIALCGTVVSSHVQAQENTIPNWEKGQSFFTKGTGQSIHSFVTNQNRQNSFSGVVLAAKNGKIISVTAVGKQEPDASDPIKSTTLFEIGSATKSFTALALVQLQQQGKLDLDDSIAKYLPNVPKGSRAITVRHLLQHTSGIPGTQYGNGSEDLQEVVPHLLKGGPQHEPGTHYEYWNQGYALLSAVVEKTSGKPYVEYCHEAIFKPAKMQSSCFNGAKKPAKVDVATGTSIRGKSRSALDHPYGHVYGYKYRGMGGLVTNVRDLWSWSRALSSHELANESSLNEMWTLAKNGYALGWRKKGTGKQTCWHHLGSVRGFLSAVQLYPEVDGCLFVLCNHDDPKLFFETLKGCEQRLFPELASTRRPLKLSMVRRIAGTYQSGKRTLKISADTTPPQADILWGGPVTRGQLTLNEKGQIEFEGPGQNSIVTFEFNDQDQATSCTLYKMTFTRDLPKTLFRQFNSLGIHRDRSASISAGDLDGDGDLDLVVANGRHWPGQNRIFINNGKGGFTVERNLGEDRATTYSIPLADLDGDGDLDAVVGNDRAPSLVMLNDGKGKFVKGQQLGGIANTRSVTLADLDQKNGVDILITNRREPNQIFFNNGKGKFERVETFGEKSDSTISVAVADLNGDGHPDLALANRDRQQNYVYLNDGNGSFPRRIKYGSGRDQTRGVAIIDADGDGNFDLLNANIGEPNAIYFGDGKGGFERTERFGKNDNSYDIAAERDQQTGVLTIVVANAGSKNVAYQRNRQGKLEAFPFGIESAATYGLIFVDVNGDGLTEVITANSDQQNGLFRRQANRRKK